MKRIRIDVTDDDIDHGVGCDSTACMVTRAVMRHVRPEVQVKTDYDHIELSLQAPIVTPGGLEIHPGEMGWKYDIKLPSEGGYFIGRRIRQFDEWTSSLTNVVLRESYKITGDWPERPKPFSFAIDVPERFLAVARMPDLPATPPETTTPIPAVDPDNTSDLRVPKHTELLPA